MGNDMPAGAPTPNRTESVNQYTRKEAPANQEKKTY
jgi:hypothetical protein